MTLYLSNKRNNHNRAKRHVILFHEFDFNFNLKNIFISFKREVFSIPLFFYALVFVDVG